jgi:hypothetical protein
MFYLCAGALPMEIDIPWVEPHKHLPEHFTVLIYGQRRSGKSTWMTWLLYCLQYRFDHVVCFCSTGFENYFQQFMNPKLCFNEYREEVLQKVLDRQSNDIAIKLSNDKHKVPSVLVILDDVLQHETEFRQSVALRTLFTAGRHFNLSCILATQYSKAIPPTFRQNADLVVLFFVFSQEQMKIFFDEYGTLLDRTEFNSLLEQVTKDHIAFVVRPCSGGREFGEYYALTRAQKHPTFYIGKPPTADTDAE